MLQISRLDSKSSQPYESLTFQYAHPLLTKLDAGSSILAIGAEWVDKGTSVAVGLLVLICPEGADAEVVSLFVKSEYRRRGIASDLLRRAEQILKVRPRTMLSFTYYSGKAITPVVEAFLRREGWSEPEMEGKVYKTDARIAEAPWVRKTGMPSGMRSFYWQELCEEEKTRLEKLEGSLYPAYLSPFKKRLPMEASNSLGLRSNGETVGWCVTYRIAEDTLLYDSVYVIPKYRLSGFAFMLIAQSISIQLERGIPRAIFAVNQQAPYMCQILDRWLAPYTTGISERKVAYKQIGTAGGVSLGSGNG